MHRGSVIFLFLFYAFIASVISQNFLIILTDDQDLLLKSLGPLKKIESLLTNQGVFFSNAVCLTEVKTLT